MSATKTSRAAERVIGRLAIATAISFPLWLLSIFVSLTVDPAGTWGTPFLMSWFWAHFAMGLFLVIAAALFGVLPVGEGRR